MQKVTGNKGELDASAKMISVQLCSVIGDAFISCTCAGLEGKLKCVLRNTSLAWRSLCSDLQVNKSTSQKHTLF